MLFFKANLEVENAATSNLLPEILETTTGDFLPS